MSMKYRKDMAKVQDTWRHLVAIVVLMCPLAGTFNLDLSKPVIHHGEPGSYFGYAVAQHLDASQPWLLIGAPQAQTDQEGVERGGSVFRCRVMEDDCHTIPFDTGPSNQYENKSHQWMGATIASSSRNTVIVACAPHYISYTRTLEKREPVGICYVSSGVITAFTPYSPCEDAGWGHHREGHCQAGFSAALSENGTWLMIGAVGSYYWQGQLYSQNLEQRYDRYRTRESPKNYDDGYLGYSMVGGKFSRNTVQDYALGVPKGADLRGKVCVFHQNATLMVNVTGKQLGEYFGYAVASSDLNGDGHADLIVGAPLYTDYSSDAYETGRVQVFYYRPGITFHATYSSEVKGRMKVGVRFGSAVAGLGDINNDAFEDVAVGAPYGGENGEGAVYIFLGSPSGIRPKPSQVIYGSVLDPSLRTFGFSMSGGNDMDSNTYPDLLIGAFDSDRTVFLRARPIIRVSARVDLSPSVINLEEKFCTLGDGTPVVCVNIATCLSYGGRRVPSKIHLSLSWTLDKHAGRIFMLNGTDRETTMQENWTLRKNQKTCQDYLAYLKTPIRDKLSAITVSVNYSLLSHNGSRNRDLPPILDQDLPNNATGEAEIWRNCGDDNICVPDLRMRVDSHSPAVIIGVPNDLEIFIHVENAGEDAFEAAVRTRLPPGVTYRNVHRVEASLPVRCAVSEQEEDVVVCDIGNPLPAGTTSSFALRVSPSRVNGTDRFLDFQFNATSANPEDLPTVTDNFVHLSIPVVVVTELQLTGVSRPEQVFFNSSALDDVTADEHAGPEVDHVYEIRNIGPGALDSASLEIHWPSFLGSDLDLLYLTFEPEIIEGSGHCEAQLVNHRGLEVALRDFGLDELLSRQRRSTDTKMKKRMAEDNRIRKVNCESDSDWCTIIRCDLGPLEKDESAVVLIRSRLWVHTLALVGLSGLVISSRAIAQVMSVPYVIKPEEYFIDTFQVDTYAAAVDIGPGERPLQIWIIALAVSIGICLLILLILCLWKCGFFRRQSADDMERLYQAKRIRNTLVTNSNGTKVTAKYDSLPGDAY